MSGQVAVIVLVDVAAALADRTLEGSIHLLDNARADGSTGQGTPELVTAVNGSHWSDGSQADAQVINWALYGIGSIPPTVPRGYLATARGRGGDRAADGTDRPAGKAIGEIADLTGGVHTVATPGPGRLPVTHDHPEPVLTAIDGEAVDSGVLHPAVYGSPDLVTDGWYWSAAVDTTRPGTYRYTLRIELHEPVLGDGRWTWQPVRFAHQAAIKVTNAAKRNGFTGAGLGPLPLATPSAAPFPEEEGAHDRRG